MTNSALSYEELNYATVETEKYFWVIVTWFVVGQISIGISYRKSQTFD